MTPGISVIILNCNGKEFLKGCLSSILRQSYGNFKVILVDNNSTDGSLDFVRGNFPEVEVLALEKNYGFSKGLNTGIKYALKNYNPEYFFLLNNDTDIVERETLNKLAEFAESDEKTGILGCKLIHPDGRPQCVAGKFNYLSRFLFTWMDPLKAMSREAYEADIIIGAVLFIKASVINKIGLLDEGFSPILSEDIDYCIRARRSGFLLKIIPSLEIIHYSGQCLDKQPLDYISWVNEKNQIRFLLLNAPLYLLILGVLCEFYNVFKHLVIAMSGRKKALKDILAYPFTLYWINIKNLKEIIWKRNHRTAKIWF